MHFHRLFFGASLVMLNSLNPVAAMPNALFPRTDCTISSGAKGTCQSTSACSGLSTPGFCPGAADIQCCTSYGTCKLSDGTGGDCKKTSACSGKSTAGLCPGPANIQCCTAAAKDYGSCKLGDGTAGTCKATSSCSGTSTPGFCPGAANIQCCTAKASTPPSTGGGVLPGLNSVQSAHARVIASVVHAKGMPIRGCEVAIATAMQESSIRILANSGVPASYNYPHDGVGSDHDSVGIFQQRPSWGSVKDRMDAAASARFFLNALARVSGWQSMSIAKAAQTVQVSAFPDAYAKWESLATKVCKAAF